MPDINVRSDSVDVEQIMRQIRARIREKRGSDYTETELQQLASVKLQQFLDPRGVRSDLVEQFRRHRIVSDAPPNYVFEDTTIYETHRAPIRWIRKVLNPILKLFFNPNPISSALHVQAEVNAEFHRRFRQREDMDPLFFEVIHNLVVETTRLGIETQNLRMRVESLTSRLDFDERRARALESVVEYRPAAARAPDAQTRGGGDDRPGPAGGAQPGGREGGPDSELRRRRRRRRRRRPGQTAADGGPGGQGQGPRPAGQPAPDNGGAERPEAAPDAHPSPDDRDGPDDGGGGDEGGGGDTDQ